MEEKGRRLRKGRRNGWKKRGEGFDRGEERRVEEKGRRLRQGRGEMDGRKGA